MRWFSSYDSVRHPAAVPPYIPDLKPGMRRFPAFFQAGIGSAGRTCDANSTMSPRRYATGQVGAGVVNPGNPGLKRQSVLERVAKTTSVGIRNCVQLAGRGICARCGRGKDGKPSMDGLLSGGAPRLPSNSAAGYHSVPSAPARLCHTSSGASASPSDEPHSS